MVESWDAQNVTWYGRKEYHALLERIGMYELLKETHGIHVILKDGREIYWVGFRGKLHGSHFFQFGVSTSEQSARQGIHELLKNKAFTAIYDDKREVVLLQNIERLLIVPLPVIQERLSALQRIDAPALKTRDILFIGVVE